MSPDLNVWFRENTNDDFQRRLDSILLFTYLALPQGQRHHKSICQLLWARIT